MAAVMQRATEQRCLGMKRHGRGEGRSKVIVLKQSRVCPSMARYSDGKAGGRESSLPVALSIGSCDLG